MTLHEATVSTFNLKGPLTSALIVHSHSWLIANAMSSVLMLFGSIISLAVLLPSAHIDRHAAAK